MPGINQDGIPNQATLVLSPYKGTTAVNLGTQINGGILTQVFTLVANGGPVSVTGIGVTGAGYSILSAPSLPFVVVPGTPVTFTVKCTEAGAGTYAGTLTVTYRTIGGQFVVPLTCNFAAAALISVPSQANFPLGKVNTAFQVVLNIQNPTGGSITVTAVNFSDGNYTSDPGNPSLPFTILAGGNVNFQINYSNTELGVISSTVTFVNSVANLVVQINSSTVWLVPVDALTGATKQLAFFYDAVNGPLGKAVAFAPPVFDIDQLGTIIFNGMLWGNPGNEKALMGAELLYENVGVCTGLTLSARVWRQAINAFDTATDSITIGDVSADGSERSAMFDFELTGEIIELTLSRPISAGPCSLIAIIPKFEDKGEKVEST